MQLAIQNSTLDVAIPEYELAPSRSIPSLRLTGPRGDGKPAVVESEVFGICLSFYPRVPYIQDGKVLLKKERQGSTPPFPIMNTHAFQEIRFVTNFVWSDITTERWWRLLMDATGA